MQENMIEYFSIVIYIIYNIYYNTEIFNYIFLYLKYYVLSTETVVQLFF